MATSIIVIPKYIKYKILVVIFNFEVILPTCGPGDSAFNKWRAEPSSLSGIKIKMKTRIPIPPIQCVKLRQKSILCDKSVTFNSSTPSNILAPVVVRPDIVSNMALIKFFISPLIINGKAPKIVMTIQTKAHTANPSFWYRPLRLGFNNCNKYPPINKIAIGIINASLYI